MTGSVLIYSVHKNEPEHERACHIELGRRLSLILGRTFEAYPNGPVCTACAHVDGVAPYLIATDTIIGADQAHEPGIHDDSNVFGGAAPYDFMPTNAISHSLSADDDAAPHG